MEDQVKVPFEVQLARLNTTFVVDEVWRTPFEAMTLC